MSSWETFGSTYIEAVASKLPMHRLVVVVLGSIGSIKIDHQTYLSIFESIVRLSVSSLFDLTSGLAAIATIANIIAGVLLAAIGWGASRILVKLIFAAASNLTDLPRRALMATAKPLIRASDPISDRQAMVTLIDSTLEIPQKRIRSLNSTSELLVSLGLGFILASIWGNILDASLGFLLITLSIVFNIISVQLFLSEYFGPAMFRARLQGKVLPTPSDI